VVAPVVVREVDVGERALLALTFDDGPGDWTPAILDLLDRHGARATFFCLGERVRERAAILQRALAEGHELGNHLFSHRHPQALSDDDIRREIALTAAQIERATAARAPLLRPPYGAQPERVAAAGAELGFGPVVLWSIDPEDWKEPPPTAIVEHVLREARPGAIVDLHDGWGRTPGDRQPTVEALGRLLPELASLGFELAIVSELLDAARPAR
jgi:peptidoglycan/xylan/chitin deacetylase (PgdA/CDA1 family)